MMHFKKRVSGRLEEDEQDVRSGNQFDWSVHRNMIALASWMMMEMGMVLRLEALVDVMVLLYLILASMSLTYCISNGIGMEKCIGLSMHDMRCTHVHTRRSMCYTMW